jgi:hypothetical protein
LNLIDVSSLGQRDSEKGEIVLAYVKHNREQNLMERGEIIIKYSNHSTTKNKIKFLGLGM